jgi:pyruvate dehydrogenase E2 component (dihydrolipoamide acetyltransferase)
MAYEADVAGTLLEILVGEDETAPVGALIARIGEPEAALPDAAPAPVETPPATLAPPQTEAPSKSGGAPERFPGARVKASPLARRVAQELDVDVANLVGSGPAGRIVKRDVEAASGSAAPVAPATTPVAAPALFGSPETAKGQVEVVEPTRLQQVVSRRMSESKATAPHFYLTTEVDMGAAVAARARIKELSGEGNVVPSFNDMVVKACAIALGKFPRANGAYKDGRFELYSRINVGIAVAADDALVVPTVFDADKKGLRELAADARALAGKVRDGSITPPELSGGTFSVSNLGMYGISSFQAIVNSPQAGILAVGAIADRPVVKDGEIVPGKLMEMSLSCDHRILYGADGAEVRRLLEEPIGLAL